MLIRFWHGRSHRSHSTPRDKRKNRRSRLGIESLEERCLLSTDVVILWNQAVLNAIRADRPTIGFLTRDLAIVHTAENSVVWGGIHFRFDVVAGQTLGESVAQFVTA